MYAHTYVCMYIGRYVCTMSICISHLYAPHAVATCLRTIAAQRNTSRALCADRENIVCVRLIHVPFPPCSCGRWFIRES